MNIMLFDTIILQSAGSLSVAIFALLMVVLQALFFFKRPQFTWYGWSAAISFSALLYSIGIFIEYNTPQGPINRFSGLLEFTAIICLIHSLYGFTFAYLGIECKRYHSIAGLFHGLILILLWFTHSIVSEEFTAHHLMGLKSPYIEPALGFLGPFFVFYAAIASAYAIPVWLRHKGRELKNRVLYVAGMSLWILLGIHDGLVSLGISSFQYMMEYGFLGFAMVVLWVVFNSYLEIAAEEKYRIITEFANDCILVIQGGRMVFGNPACRKMIGRPSADFADKDFFDLIMPEDREGLLKHHRDILEGGRVSNPHIIRILRQNQELRFVETTSSLIQYRSRPAVLTIMRDMTERKREEEELKTTNIELREAHKSLAIAYAQMREWKDQLSSQLQGDETGFLIDENGQILGITERALAFTGMNTSQLLGSNLLDLVNKDYRQAVRKLIQEAPTGIFNQLSVVFARKQTGAQEFKAKLVSLSMRSGRTVIVLLRGW